MAPSSVFRKNGSRSTTAGSVFTAGNSKLRGKYVKSPSLAYCVKCQVTGEVDLSQVQAVRCADRQGEGFHNIADIIG